VPFFGDTPRFYDRMKSSADRTTLDVIVRQTQFARPLAAPSGTPPERVAALRKAMLGTLRDPALIVDAKRIRIEFNPVPGAEAASIFAGYYNTSPAIVKKAMALIGRKQVCPKRAATTPDLNISVVFLKLLTVCGGSLKLQRDQ